MGQRVGLISVKLSLLSFFTQGRSLRWRYFASSSWPPCGLWAERPSVYQTVGFMPDDQVGPWGPNTLVWVWIEELDICECCIDFLGNFITCLEECKMCLEEMVLKITSDRVVVVGIHRHRCGLRHVHHRPGCSNLPRHLHGIQREPSDPQLRLGQGKLPWDAGHIRSAASGEIQLTHQRGKTSAGVNWLLTNMVSIEAGGRRAC